MQTRDPSGQSGVLVLLGVLFTIILAGLDNTIVSTVIPVALPELGGAHLYAWTFAAYMLAAAVSMPIWGPGSDRWGRRRTYLVGIVVFTVGSALCAVSRTMVEFIAARAVQGIGAGAVATLPFVLLGVVYPPEKRGRALGAASTAWAIASVAGPLLGTLIVTHVSWRSAFLINVPIAIVAAFLVIAGMRESIGQSVGRFDLAGALLAGAGGSALMWAFVDLGEGKIGLIQAALIAAGIILLAVFVWHEGRTPNPILPLSFFRHSGYAASTSSSFLAFFSGFGLSSYLPLATNAAFHENRAIVGVVVGAFTSRLERIRFRHRTPRSPDRRTSSANSQKLTGSSLITNTTVCRSGAHTPLRSHRESEPGRMLGETRRGERASALNASLSAPAPGSVGTRRSRQLVPRFCDDKHPVRLEKKVACPVACVQRRRLLAVRNKQAKRRAAGSEHSGVHRTH
jgi:MFS family permease